MNPYWQLKNTQKNCWQKFFAFLDAYKLKSELIKALNYFDFSRSYGRLSKNSKIGDFWELFLLENDFKTCSTVNFPKKTYFGGLKTNH